jgi:hypothetical protein
MLDVFFDNFLIKEETDSDAARKNTTPEKTVMLLRGYVRIIILG